MNKQANSAPAVDLVIIIDTSASMRDEARNLSDAAASAIAKAKSSCPSDLRVVWLGIESIWKGTNFDQTIRNYLTQTAKVAESKLRGRKIGTVKSAGAQEDGARAIEDICEHFNWRAGAARGIFYLGDEALEGGGDKTEQKDIQAADLAIQKAQKAGVTVHTYFGTSNSKHQEGIKSEYARIASSTGGQFFTNKDAISGFSAVLEKVICGSRTPNTITTPKTIKLQPGAVYIQDCVTNQLSKLYTLDLVTGKAAFIGEIVTEVSDIAFVGSQLYGLDREGEKTRLVKIDLNSGNATVIGDIGFAAAGLAYNRQRQALYATTAKQLIAINLDTGKGTPAVTVADKDFNCGEVAFNAEGKAYITLIGYDKKKLLASTNLDTGEVKTIGDIGFADVASMEFVGDVLYGVTGNFFNLGKDGQLIRIDTKTGKGTLIATTEPVGRWAGISLYEPVTAATTVITSEAQSQKAKVPQAITTAKKESMSILTIDTKNNCYVIDANQMNNLQQNVASSYVFEKGTYDIRITGGRYSYAKTKTEGEPFVLLWIYGVDGHTFINKNTGFEVGATWTTLNGYNDTLKLEVKEKAVLNALFFDVNNAENNGAINLAISSNKPFFNPQTLTVDSKRNCYVLDEKYLSSLKQSGDNFVELNPGNYRLKIREGNASYWSENKQFNIEPWALIWLKGGKTITKLTGIEVEETWLSLNGLKDEVVLEVKEKTTLTGLFIDTFKDDNEGRIILAIEEVSVTELTERYQKQEKTFTSVTTETVTNIEGNSGNVNREPIGVSSSMNFSFSFNDEEFKKKWEQQLQQINASIKVIDQADVTLEAKYWDQLEQWLLKNYEKHFKNLSVEIAKVRFSMDAYQQQMEFNLNQYLQGWSSYLDKLLADKINVEITTRINQQINQYVDQTFEQRIRNNVGLIVNNIVNKQELNQYIDRHVNQQIDQTFEQRIRNNVGLIINNLVNKQELNQYIDQHVNQQVDQSFEQKVRNNVSLIISNLVNKQELNQYIDSHVNQQVDQSFEQKIQNNVELIINSIVNKQELNQYIDSHVNQQVDQTFEQKIQNNVNLITQSIVANNTEINKYVNQQIDQTFADKITNNVELIVNSIVNKQELNQYLEQTFEQKIQNNVNLITQSIVSDNTEINQYVNQQIDQTFADKIANNVELIVNSIVNKQELNQYIDSHINQQLDQSFEQKIQNNVNLITQSIVSNNTEINQYVNQQIDQTFADKITNNVELIVNSIVNKQELNQYIDSHVNQQLDQTFEQKIQNNVNLITQSIVANNTEINQYLNQQIDQIFGDKISNNVELIVNNIIKKQELNQYIDQHVEQKLDQSFEQKIRNNIKLITQNLITENTELNQYFSQEIDNSFEQKIQNHIQVITENIINDNDVFNNYVDHRLQQTVNHNTDVNNNIVNLVANSNQFTTRIENIRNEWNETFISLVTQRVDDLIHIIGGREAFIKLITQNVVNNNTDINQYVSQQIDNTYEQKVKNYVKLITQNIVNNNDVLNQYVDQRLHHNVTNNNVIINQIFDNEQITQKIQAIFNDNSQIHQKIENVVINSTEINNRILNFVVNSTEINNKINNVYRDIDIKIENVRNEWNQSFITLVRQYVNELINIIGDNDTFNLRIANVINFKVDELLNQILRIRNELTVIIHNADRNLYEWTLGELMAIKGCLTDRQALVEQLVTFSSELRVKLDNTNCVDINTFKPFKPLSIPQQLPGNK
ncbi:hypothetical protein NIES2100_22620 [Calothrix sp. NIES-2100]|uniref:hypothetical protein n=1 Tax=Calothrix sp. NIES-2100 TaxID=1954172 RepID=UPI000B5FF611|nr:hypothetical protein NIES2100_22620 [Calothrix sp. NIES-2100]